MVKHVGGASKGGLQPRVGVGLVRRQQRGTGHSRLARKRGHESSDIGTGKPILLIRPRISSMQ
jgi:hypothetical protein